jgi:hypothetical protein
MQDEIGHEPGRALDEVEHTVLWLLLRPSSPSGMWSHKEIAREVGDPEAAGMVVAGLHAAGLAHRVGDFAFATQAAARFRALALDGTR